MKKSAIALPILCILLIAGCGQKGSPPVGPFPTVERLLSDGWTAYKRGEFEDAAAKFDSAIDINALGVEAHLGAGWSKVHLSRFRDSRINFALAVSIEGTSPIFDVLKEDSDADSSWIIKPINKPLLGLASLTINSTRIDSIVGVDTFTTAVIYEVKEFTDSTITLEWSAENGAEITPTLPMQQDILEVYYTYYRGGEEGHQIDGYCGNSAGYAAEASWLQTVINGNAVLVMDTSYVFYRDSTITARRVHILLAQAYFSQRLYENSLKEVLILDPDWEYDRESPTFLYELQKKIQELMGG